MSHRRPRQSKDLEEVARSSEQVMSYCRSSERVMSYFRSSERVMSYCRSSERVMSHCRSSERVMSSERVTLGDWHELRLSRTGRLAILEVDDLPATQTMTPGAFTQLSLPQNLYIGGVPNFDMVSPKVRIRTSFVGCIQKVVINNQPLQILAGALGGVNVDNCPHPCVARPCGERGHCVPQLDYFTCSCGPGFDDPQCQQHAAPVLLDDIPVPRFTGDSFLHYSDPDTIRRIVSFRLNINMRFRTSSQAGLMLWSGRRNMTSSSDFLALGLAQGVLHFRFNLGSGEVDIPYNCTGVSDGLWHRVKAVRNEQEGSLVVDNGPVVTKRAPGHLRQLNTNTGLYIGGMDNIKHSSMDKYAGGLVGCISDLILDTDYHVKLVQMSTAGRNIKHCG
uniref:Pikachurin n=1 Tax=Timema shepardi TaxID=629360 RepID=A0A7R9B1B3_TIMSH|nr:unnamed protein product [Timema shepardi]